MNAEEMIFISHDGKPVMDGETVYAVILSSAGFCTSRFEAKEGLNRNKGYDSSIWVIFKSRYLAKKYEAERIRYLKNNLKYYTNLSKYYNRIGQ